MQEHELTALIASADEAINREDFDALMRFYAEDATLVVVPGKNATGPEQIRHAFEAIAEHFNHTLFVSQGKMVVVEGGDTALVLANTLVRARLKAGTPYLAERKATYVFRRTPGGTWLCTVDNSYGSDLLAQAEQCA